MHLRRAILEELKTQLKASNAFAGVWIQRTGPARQVFPSITLYADQEQVETLTIHRSPRPQERVLNISVLVWIRGTANDERPDEQMDVASSVVEATIKLPAIADDLVLLATDFFVDEEEPEIHAVTLTYSIKYSTKEY